jgi:signal transduction histidine kinase
VAGCGRAHDLLGVPTIMQLTATRTVLLVALWTAFGLLSSAHFFFRKSTVEGDASFTDLASHILVFYWGWALLTPAVLYVARRAIRSGPSASHASSRAWPIVALAAPVAVVAHGIWYLAVIRLVGVEPLARVSVPALRDYAMRHGGGDVATFAVLVGVQLLLEVNRRARERAVATSALEARLARADLELLRWQLHPHFLFNALNTVSTLVIKGETQPAERAISLISRYLRDALTQRADATTTLAEEMEVVRRYVAIETLRFGETLCVESRMDDVALGARVPGLIVQPLVENAIRHGLARGGAITVAATVRDSRLRLTVSDPGAGGTRDAATDGFGLRYVRERLQQFHGAGATLDLAIGAGGSVATLDLPFVVEGRT